MVFFASGQDVNRKQPYSVCTRAGGLSWETALDSSPRAIHWWDPPICLQTFQRQSPPHVRHDGDEASAPRDTTRIQNVKHVRAAQDTRAFFLSLLSPFYRLFIFFISVRRTKSKIKNKKPVQRTIKARVHRIIVRQRQKFVCFDTCGSEGVSHKVIRTLCKSYYSITQSFYTISLARHFGTYARIIIACVQVLWRC